MIPVTRPVLPPLDEYTRLLAGVWERCWLTNDGPLVRELESRLAEYLGVRHVLFTSNGTIAIQLAIKALELQGEIITTPFSYVATTSTIVWEGCVPVYADVERVTLTVDPHAVEAAITPRTSAILGTHVYGIPCDTEAIAEIARRRGLRVIYDAAHAFAARYLGRALASFGDISTLSFHATKLFHTVEGGAVVTDDDRLADRLRRMRNFGHDGSDRFQDVGINGKNSEVHAAMGLALLPRVGALVAARRAVVHAYDAVLGDTELVRPQPRPGTEWNYAYYPVLFPSEDRLLRVQTVLTTAGIGTRRYFYPSLNCLPYVSRGSVPVSEDAAARVLCLPLYADLASSDATKIGEIIRTSLREP